MLVDILFYNLHLTNIKKKMVILHIIIISTIEFSNLWSQKKSWCPNDHNDMSQISCRPPDQKLLSKKEFNNLWKSLIFLYIKKKH